MANQVYANGREVSCKSGSGKVTAATPDVCLSPPSPPAGPVPVPYPVSSFSSDTTDGSKSVKISGKEVMLKDKSYFKKCTGDEAATKSLGMGVVTHNITGKVYFVSWSMDVEIEGENVVRHLDMTTSNHMSQPGNTPPMAETEEQQTPSDCGDAKKSLDAAQAEMSPSLKKGATVAAGKFTPAAGGPASLLKGASSVGWDVIARGKKYLGYANGISTRMLSFVPGFSYLPNVGRPFQGHAEARIIEDLFQKARPGLPQGKLSLKISQPPCPQCQKLIDAARAKGLDVVICE